MFGNASAGFIELRSVNEAIVNQFSQLSPREPPERRRRLNEDDQQQIEPYAAGGSDQDDESVHSFFHETDQQQGNVDPSSEDAVVYSADEMISETENLLNGKFLSRLVMCIRTEAIIHAGQNICTCNMSQQTSRHMHTCVMMKHAVPHDGKNIYLCCVI